MPNYILTSNRQTAQGMNVAQNKYYQIERIVPLVDKYAAHALGGIARMDARCRTHLDPSAKMYQEMRRISEKGTVDDMLALASKYPPEFQKCFIRMRPGKPSPVAIPPRERDRRQNSRSVQHDRSPPNRNQAARRPKATIKLLKRAASREGKHVQRKIDILIQPPTRS